MADEDGLATPLDDDLLCVSVDSRLSISWCPWISEYCVTYVLALRDSVEVDLNLGHGQDIGRGGHVDEELCDAIISSSSRIRVQ